MDPRLGGHGRGESESGPGQTDQKVTPGRCIGLNQVFKSRMNQVTDISTSLDHIAHHLCGERDLKDRGTCTSLERPLHLATHREPCLSSSSASNPAGCWCEFKPWTGQSNGANPPSRDTWKRPKAPLATSLPAACAETQMASRTFGRRPTERACPSSAKHPPHH